MLALPNSRSYNNCIEITYDQTKDGINLRKLGLSLAQAKLIEWDTLLVKADTRREYGEQRLIGYALIGTRLHCVVFTDRGNERRVISLRRANPREVKNHVAEI